MAGSGVTNGLCDICRLCCDRGISRSAFLAKTLQRKRPRRAIGIKSLRTCSQSMLPVVQWAGRLPDTLTRMYLSIVSRRLIT